MKCSKILELKKSQEQHACNIGLIKGLQEFKYNVQEHPKTSEVEECELEVEEKEESRLNMSEQIEEDDPIKEEWWISRFYIEQIKNY